MEACDDIAYSVIDIEDAIKKGLISINDVIVAIDLIGDNARSLSTEIKNKVEALRQEKRSPHDINDIGTQYYRTFSIHKMINAASDAFYENKDSIISGNFDGDLMSNSSCAHLCKGLKEFAYKHAYTAPAVKEVELRGDNLLHGLLDYFWRSILECSIDAKRYPKISSAVKCPPATPFGEFVYSHISRNYIACFDKGLEGWAEGGNLLTIRYHQLLLLTDMVSGMAENFAIDLYDKFKRLDDGAN